MIRIVALLAFIASASAIWPFDSKPNKLWNPGFSHTFGLGLGAFSDLPRNMKDCEKAGWVEVKGPDMGQYDDLTLMMNPSDDTTGLYFDGVNLAGMFLSMPTDKVQVYFDPIEQGLKEWTCDVTGVTKTYYISCFFFVPGDKSARTYDSNQVIQGDKIWFLGNYGEITPVATTRAELDANWNIQSCVILMGRHYYYNMTKDTTCDKAFFPYFLLVDEQTGQLIGIGYMSIGACETIATAEHPDLKAVKMIVKDGPECLYDLVKSNQVCTHHCYFVDRPRLINCSL